MEGDKKCSERAVDHFMIESQNEEIPTFLSTEPLHQSDAVPLHRSDKCRLRC